MKIRQHTVYSHLGFCIVVQREDVNSVVKRAVKQLETVQLFHTSNQGEYDIYKKFLRAQYRHTFAHATAISENRAEEAKAEP